MVEVWRQFLNLGPLPANAPAGNGLSTHAPSRLTFGTVTLPGRH